MTRATIYERTYLPDPRIKIRYCGFCHQPMKSHPGHSNRSCQQPEMQPDATERGELEENDIPMHVSRPKRLGGQMVRFLERSNDPYDRAMKALHQRHPEWEEVFWRHKAKGEPIKQIAASLGITVVNARQRSSRGARFFKERYTLYGGDPNDL